MTEKKFLFELYEAHRHCKEVPSPESICKLINGVIQILFPQLSDKHYTLMSEFEKDYEMTRIDLSKMLHGLDGQMEQSAEAIVEDFYQQLPCLRTDLLQDARAINDGDPAALSVTEVIRTYPGFYAVAVYRIAHFFWQQKVPLVPRILSEYAHNKTGIEIHPGAVIGNSFCIDHGTGIVIGGTAVIGNNVKIYQGVTLGALSVKKEMASTKRHPTIQDNVVIYAGATILGGKTVIGHDSIIGGNVWVTKSVHPFSRLYYKAPRQESILA